MTWSQFLDSPLSPITFLIILAIIIFLGSSLGGHNRSAPRKETRLSYSEPEIIAGGVVTGCSGGDCIGASLGRRGPADYRFAIDTPPARRPKQVIEPVIVEGIYYEQRGLAAPAKQLTAPTVGAEPIVIRHPVTVRRNR